MGTEDAGRTARGARRLWWVLIAVGSALLLLAAVAYIAVSLCAAPAGSSPRADGAVSDAQGGRPG